MTTHDQQHLLDEIATRIEEITQVSLPQEGLHQIAQQALDEDRLNDIPWLEQEVKAYVQKEKETRDQEILASIEISKPREVHSQQDLDQVALDHKEWMSSVLSGKQNIATSKRANLENANLNGMNLSQMNLSCASLKGAQLIGANLTKTNLSKAHLEGANLQGAKLIETNFRGAHMSGVDWREADIKDIIHPPSHENK